MSAAEPLAARLRNLAEELLNEAAALDEAEGRPRSRCPLLPVPERSELESMRPRFLRQARAAYDARMLRSSFVDGALLGEPAWDMLLDLYIQHGRGQQISVSSACLASHAPPTTALRYVELLHSLGLIDKVRSGTDKRVLLVTLSDAGIDALDRYFWMSFARQGEVRG